MNRPVSPWLALAALLLPVFAATQEPATAIVAPYPGWQYSGSLMILTTPEGANLPAGTAVAEFPLLVRLHRDWFDFAQARSSGEDIRFSSRTGAPLPYQIEEWDAARGAASIWVRIPTIQGNERQELRMHWGKSDAVSESSGSAVFNEANGYLSVWHMNGPVKDEVGTLESKDVGTTPTAGIIGPARHLAGRQGIFGGDKILNYPVGASPHSSEVWFRAEKSNGRPLAWGNEQGQGKVVLHFQSPPHLRMDCYFSGADVASTGRMPMNEWIHVVHTYRPGDSRIYVNGVLSGVSARPNAPLAIKTPARLWIGGWYHHYDFIGDIDEVRISRVARSADWVKLQHENQQAYQTLVGPVMQPGNAFAVSPATASVPEGRSATFTAQAGGAQKVYWSLVQDGRETVAAVDRFSFQFDAGRVSGNTATTLRFRAGFPSQVRTQDISITIQEAIAEPVFTLKAPPTWDGRETIEIVPEISNLQTMEAEGAGRLKTEWSAGPFAVVQEAAPGKLVLKRAQQSGQLTVAATIDNGGRSVAQTATIDVTEPARDAWVARTHGPDEKPEDGQFFARDDRNEGTLVYKGSLGEPADSVFLKLYADDRLVRAESARPASDGSYVLEAKLKPGLIRYRVEFGTQRGGRESVRDTATNLVCGDAYLIDGQSNALATDTSEKSPPETHEWIRSYGQAPAKAKDPGNLWCHPVWKAQKGEKAELGWWGMELAKGLVESQKMPIFLLNAAAGGTRIDQHQRNPANPTDLSTLYGRMLWRVQQAKLTHGIRGILWHQGENDQGADGPTGGYGWETYHPLFVEMAAGWKQDFPNVQHYYVFQIWPNSCSMGGRDGSGDRLREKQRTLPQLFSHLSIMSTLGIRPPGGCHFPLAGWSEMARLIQPLIERDHYGKVPAASITPPNLRHAARTSGTNDAIVLEFDQPVVWTDALAGQFYLDGEKGQVASGSVTGNRLTLRLRSASKAKTITYLKDVAWSQDTLLLGANGLAAFTFCDVPIVPSIRVLVWDEQQPEQKRAYGDRFLGETIAAHLAAQPGFTVKTASLASPAQGLDDATLNGTDVLIWWSHVKNPFVTDENVERIVTRVRQGNLGFMALHSAHWARPFVRLMQERAKDDALVQIPEADRATAKFEYFNQNPLGKVPPRGAPLTPALRQEDGVWKLTLPGCIFPAYRGDGAPSHVTTLLVEHPIAAGLPRRWDIPKTEMYDEPFHVPKPDAVVFEERWDKGEHFRSGCVWRVGNGHVFYFRPGHETFPVFKQAEPLRVVENGARWLARDPVMK